MDIETLFTSTKWSLLQALAEGTKSPQQLAKECNTSTANVSQQLRLLELAGLIKTTRLPNRDKGQPRILYQLSDDKAFIATTCAGFVKKESLPLNRLQKATLRTWFLPEKQKGKLIERTLWHLEKHLSKIESIYYDQTKITTINLIILTNDTSLKKQLKTITIEQETINIIPESPSTYKTKKEHYEIY